MALVEFCDELFANDENRKRMTPFFLTGTEMF